MEEKSSDDSIEEAKEEVETEEEKPSMSHVISVDFVGALTY